MTPAGKPVIRVVAAVISRDGEILICQRRHDDSFPLRWEFPGGKIEPGEEQRAALLRELREELGVEATIGAEIHRITHEYENKPPFHISFFRAEVGEQELKNLVFEKILWAKAADLPKYPFLGANRELVALLASGTIPT